MRVEQDDVAVVTNIREHLIELLLRWRFVIQASMRRHRADAKGVIDQRIAQRYASVQHVDDRDARFARSRALLNPPVGSRSMAMTLRPPAAAAAHSA